MGNQNTTTHRRESKNHPSNPVALPHKKGEGFFHGLEMLVEATEFVLKRSCSSAMEEAPPVSNNNNNKRLCRSKRNRKVHFHETVHYRPIEHHSWYTDQERKATWRSLNEIRVHAKRNSFEMKWEGRNWRNAAEESDMFMDNQNRIRYHPCWITTHYLPFQVGGNKLQVSYNLVLFWFVQQHGIAAFVDE